MTVETNVVGLRPLWRRIADFPLVAMVIALAILAGTIWLAGMGFRLLPKMGVPDATRQMIAGLTVVGLVHTPGQYKFPVGQNLSVLDAISLSRGINSPVANKIYIIRKRPGVPEPMLIQVSYSKAKRNGSEDNILLQPGDVVSVEQTPATVMLEVLNVAKFGITGRAF